MLSSKGHCVVPHCRGRAPVKGVLCPWHEAMMPARTHRVYLGACGLWTLGPDFYVVVRAAATLAVLASVIAYKDGLIPQEALNRVRARYAGLGIGS